MVQWIVHLKDGKSLTDDILYPHEVDVLRANGYEPDQITSIDRVVDDYTLTIRSRNMDTFFVGTEAGIDLVIQSSVKQKPAEITRRFIGGYIKDVEPFLQARLGMDPKSGTTYIEFVKTRNKAPLGINADFMESRKGKFIQTFQREIEGKIFIVFDNRYVESIKDCDGGFICSLKDNLEVMVHLKNKGIVLEVLEKKTLT